jgi:hypothetical protein
MRRQVKRLQANGSSSNYMTAVALIIESGVLYALTQVIYICETRFPIVESPQLISLILDHVSSVGLPIMLDLEIPLIVKASIFFNFPTHEPFL